MFESFDSYYPTIQKLTDVLYPDLNPQDTESIKVFMRRLGLDLLSSATNLKDKTIESITFDDLGNIDRFFERADVKKILPYLYRSDQIDSEEYRSLYLNGAKLHHLSNEIKQYFASLGDEVIDKMRAYSTAPKKENLLQFYNIIHYANPSAQMTPDLFAKMLSDHHSKFKYLSMDTLKLYFDEKLNLKTLEEKKVHIQATSQEPIWSAIYNQISEVSEAKDEEKEKILMNGMLPSPLEILKKNFIIQKVNTQKHFDELLKKIETMQGTDKTQRLLRF